MRIVLSICTLLLCFNFRMISQSENHCGTDQQRRENINRNPFLIQYEDELEQFTREYIQAHAGQRDDQVYVIPVVFHIIHQWGPENISNEQVYSAVDILNRDFRKLNADTSEIVAPFDTIVADAHIEFRLATKDFMGNCTNGIERIASTETYIGDNGSKLSMWPRANYLNIWTVADMEDGVAGYSQYPSAVIDFPLNYADGVIIRHEYVGDTGTSNEYNSRALTHEVGHYLNLSHTWGDTNDPGVQCGDDGVEDTPETAGWNNCNLNGSTCNEGVIENVQNYMEYAYCSVMYTEGQAERMHAALNSPVAARNNLWQPANLAFTGTDGETNLACAPEADFYPGNMMVCLNEEIDFYDNSTQADPTWWSWTFADGDPATSTDQFPSVAFTSPGWKQVTMECGNDLGSSTKTVTQSIFVSPPWNDVDGLPFEDFTNETLYESQWFSQNLDNNPTYWQYCDFTGYNDDRCVMINSSQQELSYIDLGGNDLDELITPSYNLSLLEEGIFSFRYAYATNSALIQDAELRVYSTKDCGINWQERYTISGFDLVTSGIVTEYFVPEEEWQWKECSFTVANILEDENIRFKFEFFSSDFSNNIYVDHINISGVVGVDELNANAFTVYPNPAEDMVTCVLNSDRTDNFTLYLSDMQGKIVKTFKPNISGSKSFTFSVEDLASGLYMMTLDSPQANQHTVLSVH